MHIHYHYVQESTRNPKDILGVLVAHCEIWHAFAFPSPSTPIKSPVACAIIWNNELDSLTLYKASYHRYRAASSWAVLVGVLETSSFVPGLFLRRAAGAVRQEN
jgi:hypothetical protein